MHDFIQSLKQRDELEGQVFELLESIGDFKTFKDLILDYKNEKLGKNVDLSGLLCISKA